MKKSHLACPFRISNFTFPSYNLFLGYIDTPPPSTHTERLTAKILMIGFRKPQNVQKISTTLFKNPAYFLYYTSVREGKKWLTNYHFCFADLSIYLVSIWHVLFVPNLLQCSSFISEQFPIKFLLLTFPVLFGINPVLKVLSLKSVL